MADLAVEASDSLAFDADNHYYEPRDVFTRHIEARYRDVALRPVCDEFGVEYLLLGDRHHDRPRLSWKLFDKAPLPGSLRENLRMIAANEIESSKVGVGVGGVVFARLEDTHGEYIDRDLRMEMLDAQGLAGALMFPSLGVLWEHSVADSPEITWANMRAFNRWLEEDWGFAYRNRIFGVPMMSLLDLESALRELDWALSRGARAVHLRAGPQGRRSPGDPYFDPFWARVQEAGIFVAFHASRSDYEGRIAPWWSDTEPEHDDSAFKHFQSFGDRPIMDSLAGLILHNVFGRFPDLKIAVLEFGAAWVPYVLRALNHAAAFGLPGLWVGGHLEARPSEIFKRNIWVAPFPEENALETVAAIGIDKVLFGSDFPHSEGLATPTEYAKQLSSLPAGDVAKIMGGNIMGLLGLS